MLLILLDLSAAFDTVDHDLLLKILYQRIGIRGNAWKWLESYLKGRTQAVNINGESSEVKSLKCGVPQGSVLGPILFTLYTQPLGDIVKKYNIQYHLYADDTQLYITFNQSSPTSMAIAKEQMEQCITEIKLWMDTYLLKLNEDKTEFMLIQSRHAKNPLTVNSLRVGQSFVEPTQCAKNIGVTFDCQLSMDKHIRNVSRSAFYSLRNISNIRKYLTTTSATTLVHAFITSKIDYCNALFVGLPAKLTDKLQKVQNAAARMVTGSRKYDHITPELFKLHWLPVKQRIKFKIILLTYKAMNGLSPEYMKDMIKVKSTSTRSNGNMLETNSMRLNSYGQRAFIAAAPCLWNALPVDLRKCQSLEKF